MGDLDNDMDELFRTAANHYPLKTDGADWDKVMGKLPEAVGDPLPFTEQKTGKNNKKLLWLVLLFPLGWLCNGYFNDKNNVSKDEKVVIINSTKELNDQQKSNDNQNNKIKNKTKSDSVSNYPAPLKYVDNRFANTVNKPKKTTDNNNMVSFLHNHPAYSDILGDQKERGILMNKNRPDEKNTTSQAIKEAILNDGEPKNTATESAKKAAGNNEIQQTDSTQKLMTNNNGGINKTQDTVALKAKKASKMAPEKRNGFYLSVLTGLDASNIKSQGVKKTGYSYGLLIGYNLNRHFAIETGLLWDKKQYYTDGSYFNKSRTTIPSTVTISDMNGNCNMFELPVELRYNFAQNKKSLFFGTAGLSSYFMKKEYYNYEASANGSSWYAAKTYNNSGNNLFSVVNLSIGYEHKISKLGNIRISPYLKIPLKGLGIGSLPITSTGVNFGLTIPFHK